MGGSGGGVGYSASSSSSAALNSQAAFDSSGWQVNYGSGSNGSGTTPTWVYAAGLAIAAAGLFILFKRGR